MNENNLEIRVLFVLVEKLFKNDNDNDNIHRFEAYVQRLLDADDPLSSNPLSVGNNDNVHPPLLPIKAFSKNDICPWKTIKLDTYIFVYHFFNFKTIHFIFIYVEIDIHFFV